MTPVAFAAELLVRDAGVRILRGRPQLVVATDRAMIEFGVNLDASWLALQVRTPGGVYSCVLALRWR